LRLSYELHVPRGHFAVVTPEIVGVEKKKDATAGLVADPARLFRRDCTGEKQACALRARRSDQYPTLVFAPTSVFDHSEVQRACEKCQGFIVIPDD